MFVVYNNKHAMININETTNVDAEDVPVMSWFAPTDGSQHIVPDVCGVA